MSISTLVRAASRLADLGPLSASLRSPASQSTGGPSRSAMVVVDTSVKRPQNIGGGTVGWHIYANVGGNGDHVAALNDLLRVFCEIIEDAGHVAATVRNAYDARRTAQAEVAATNLRMKSILESGPLRRGRFLVQRDEGRGGVWLLDPEKRGSGFGFWFESMSDLWAAHPSLRPVEWSGGDLIVEPWVFPAQEVEP